MIIIVSCSVIKYHASIIDVHQDKENVIPSLSEKVVHTNDIRNPQ